MVIYVVIIIIIITFSVGWKIEKTWYNTGKYLGLDEFQILKLMRLGATCTFAFIYNTLAYLGKFSSNLNSLFLLSNIVLVIFLIEVFRISFSSEKCINDTSGIMTYVTLVLNSRGFIFVYAGASVLVYIYYRCHNDQEACNWSSHRVIDCIESIVETIIITVFMYKSFIFFILISLIMIVLFGIIMPVLNQAKLHPLIESYFSSH